MGLSANNVSLIMALASITGAIFYLSGIKPLLMAGSILFVFAMVLDHTDGDMARITKRYSMKGIYCDHIHHTCEEVFTFIGLGIYLTITSNVDFFFIGIIITALLFIPAYFRATLCWFMKKEVRFDDKYRGLPLVFLYGNFFKMWHPLILIGLIFKFTNYIILLALIWSVFAFFYRMYIFYKECNMFDEKNNYKKGFG